MSKHPSSSCSFSNSMKKMSFTKLRVFQVLILYTVIFVPLTHASSNSDCFCSNTYSNFEYVKGRDNANDRDPKNCLDNFDVCYNKNKEFYQITKKKNTSGNWSSCSSKCDENQNKENNVNFCRVKPTPCLAEFSHFGNKPNERKCFMSKVCKVQELSCGEDEKCEKADPTNDKTKDLGPDDYVCKFKPSLLESVKTYGICQPDSCLQDGELIPNTTCLTKASNCVFPFKDDFEDSHSECTNKEHCNGENCDPDADVGFQWCATELKENGQYLRWSVCNTEICESYYNAPYKGLKRDFNWCATKTDKTGQMSHWGLCDSDSEIPDCPNEDSKDLVCEECIGDKDLCEELCGNFDYIPIIVAVIIIVLILLIISFLIWKYHTNLCPGSGTYSPPKAQAKTQEHGAFGSDMSGLDFIDKSNTNSIENLIDPPQLQESLREMRVSDVP